MQKVLVVIILLSSIVLAGTFEGELIYAPGGFGGYAVFVIGLDIIIEIVSGGTIDWESIPHDIMFLPGSFSVEGEFTDGIPYNVFAVKVMDIENLIPSSGDPMGLSADEIYPRAGSANDIEVVIDTVGAIGGYIDYGGDFGNVKVNIYDMMQPSVGAIYEGTYRAYSSDYSIVIPSGFKSLEFFADMDGNNEWDTGSEPGAEYMDFSAWGPIVFAGGGDRFATGVDITLVGIDEGKPDTHKLTLSCSPNPFNSAAIIEYSTPCKATLTITDFSGRMLRCATVYGNGAVTIGNELECGMYLVTLRDGSHCKTVRAILTK